MINAASITTLQKELIDPHRGKVRGEFKSLGNFFTVGKDLIKNVIVQVEKSAGKDLPGRDKKAVAIELLLVLVNIPLIPKGIEEQIWGLLIDFMFWAWREDDPTPAAKKAGDVDAHNLLPQSMQPQPDPLKVNFDANDKAKDLDKEPTGSSVTVESVGEGDGSIHLSRGTQADKKEVTPAIILELVKAEMKLSDGISLETAGDKLDKAGFNIENLYDKLDKLYSDKELVMILDSGDYALPLTEEQIAEIKAAAKPKAKKPKAAKKPKKK